jgi:hypothetical protein
MSNILVLYYSSHGHIEVMAQAQAEESRMPTNLELEMCRSQGEHVARITSRFTAGAQESPR